MNKSTVESCLRFVGLLYLLINLVSFLRSCVNFLFGNYLYPGDTMSSFMGGKEMVNYALASHVVGFFAAIVILVYSEQLAGFVVRSRKNLTAASDELTS